MTAHLYDVIVVGSGPAGVMCAQTLTESGKNVLMIDAGTDDKTEENGPPQNFTDIRTSSTEQASIFLGSGVEQFGVNADEAVAQMTPQRRYIFDQVNHLLPVSSTDFTLLESLSTGGLGNAWGLGCFTFSDYELHAAKLNPQQIRKAYDVISSRIGIAYTPDHINSYVAEGLLALQPGINIDDNAQALIKRYHEKRKLINNRSFHIGIPPLALLTRDKDGRKATEYKNMDFYFNSGQSAYRPSVTIKHLKSFDNFAHQRGIVILNFAEHQDFVQINGKNLKTNEEISFRAKKIVLACNVLGTARIVLRSLENNDGRVPFLSNPYTMIAALQWRRLGKLSSSNKTSTAQVCILLDQPGQHCNLPMASIYSYSSLLLYRILKKSTLNYRDSLRILQYLQSSLVIAGIHHPSSATSARYAQLKNENTLHVTSANDSDNDDLKATNQKFESVLRILGCIPFRKITLPPGSSAHYAGTLPFSDDRAPLSLSNDGLLSGTNNVYVADASGFHYLPAKGPTLTIMANAHNVALNLLKNEQ